MRILLVEDRPENLEEAKKYFSQRPELHIEYARDYKEAMTGLEAQPEGLICDLFFPEETGTGRKVVGQQLYLKVDEDLKDVVWCTKYEDLDKLMKDVCFDKDEAKQPLGVLVVEEAHKRGMPYVITSSLHAAHGSSATPVAFYLIGKGLLEDEYAVIESGGYGLKTYELDARVEDAPNPEYHRKRQIKGSYVWDVAVKRLFAKNK
ncbi:MAG: hypothetical protein HY513_04260 [Candidatus Aenigmarchaeota archaeon]|nr:hypothetical protein [Candidatus Aenigmarchaeota archaeon]